MATVSSSPPQDVVAIFHASFHPTQGNIIDWSLKASDDLSLDGVEFSSLPSGLHLVEQDTLYFTKSAHAGIAVFHRRATDADGQRGARLSSLGLLLAPSARPRPWRHTAALIALARELHASGLAEDTDAYWAPARQFFDARVARRTDLGGAGAWGGWGAELDGEAAQAHPALHLPHALRLLGPSALTLYKHLLGRRRVLLYTAPPLASASVLCHALADMCFAPEPAPALRRRDEHPGEDGVRVLGVVTLHDLAMLERESARGRGWIACTTDTMFLEKPQHYDLLVDLSAPASVGRPALRLAPRLTSVRFTWSDVALWTELDRLLRLDADTNGAGAGAPWLPDAGRLYEDACLLCAGLWLRPATSPPPPAPRVRARGDGIEGRPALPTSSLYARRRRRRRASDGSLWALGTLPGRAAGPPAILDDADSDGAKDPDAGAEEAEEDDSEEDAVLVRDRQALTARALLQTLHAHTGALLARLADAVGANGEGAGAPREVVLAPLALGLGPLSTLDARFAAWLGAAYAPRDVRVVVRRTVGWREVVGLVFGYGA
ncbi:hypothetical protein BC834DRAFT_973341 [Gloeopeniophorella convolvens]|nr:hypothetical protein BC834DRAFT_973341 [Gloeopeniophorella convolvens]